ncbi:acetyl-CoA carboxylase biotin carboxyl carrier protein [Flammeovirga kamogawensis]|uniref:Biotin carboxyl carrier protein of acetyl-CoA carboxylase n=1 Tax=Flammeovirga kamogawensis TaxID=373891 RepID=A0ABX8GY40_9BACT|nr:acetyl-CoA carboxylase biotin carboxyl carrier protein [Flammeovirga kamogawensis]MBB6460662.1 acetyl-CoA carboxylase biotin carboxyl carrier protein [Flammeovirga kamogawensis]QWG08017.1 acetyl-CoA carboxylase biotin carboxyl carrier protein [Flammeovirga kamogawensis]TRX69824.1 acetyl-CoA carboxylase biotin carboxyl carrier protein [Flammeovirga kamogawensis]
MKAPEVKDLISFIANSGLQEVNVETAEIKLHVKRNAEAIAATPVAAPVLAAQPVAPLAAAPAAELPSSAPAVEAATPAVEAPAADTSNYIEIKSPMIGTFYTAPNPDSDMFVNVGDSVKKGDVVCIIEAMKLFNEIESEVSGKIVKILVDNMSPVEYDQPLYLVDPA